MGKKKPITNTDELVEQIKLALSDDDVIAALATRIATIVADKINRRLENLEKELTDKDARIEQLEQAVDNLEQYSRRSSVRITGIVEHKDGEQIDKIITDLFNDMDMPLKMDHINRAHRIGPRKSATNKNHSRQIIVQFKDYKSKNDFIKARKRLRTKRSNVYISEDLTQKRARLLFLCRTLKKQHKILDCWSYDGRIVIKDLKGTIKTVSRDDELNAL